MTIFEQFITKWQSLQNSVIVKKSSPKNLSADCRRPTVDRQSADSLPTGQEKRKIVLKTNS